MIFLYLAQIFTNGPILKIIDYKFYITNTSRTDFEAKYTDIENVIMEITSKLEDAVNKNLMHADPPMQVKWNIIPQSEIVSQADLGKCGMNMKELVSILHKYFDYDSETSAIAMYDCDSQAYIDLFNSVNQNIPYITHNVSTVCTTRTLIFFEPESDKFASMFGTALLKAAGIRHPNPLVLEEITDGDRGKFLSYSVIDESIKQLQETSCYRN